MSGKEQYWRRSAGPNGGGLFPELPPGVAERAIAEHVERYLMLARERRTTIDRPTSVPEDLYLVDADDSTILEIVGLRLRGHPLALLGAVRFPRHRNAPTLYGRPSLADFFTKPTVQAGVAEAASPQGAIELFLPQMGETIPEMVERLRRHPPGPGVQVDVALVELAFDLRFLNPSAVPGSEQVDEPQRLLFRTTRGHLLSGFSVGFQRTRNRGLQLVTVTDAFQHRPGGQHLLPTLALNRRVLVMEAMVGPDGESNGANTLAFHPSTANPRHILGWAYDDLDPEGVAHSGKDLAFDGS